MESDGLSFRVKTINEEHTCALSFSKKGLSSWWLAKRYLNHWRANRSWSFKGFKQMVLDDLRVDITKWEFYRARKYAMSVIDGSITEQYANLWDYCHELLTCNRSSTVKM